MMQERTKLRNTKTQYKEKLESLKNYIRELKEQCHDCHTSHEHVNFDLMRAENDAQFYESQIQDINKRVKALGDKAKK